MASRTQHTLVQTIAHCGCFHWSANKMMLVHYSAQYTVSLSGFWWIVVEQQENRINSRKRRSNNQNHLDLAARKFLNRVNSASILRLAMQPFFCSKFFYLIGWIAVFELFHCYIWCEHSLIIADLLVIFILFWNSMGFPMVAARCKLGEKLRQFSHK